MAEAPTSNCIFCMNRYLCNKCTLYLFIVIRLNITSQMLFSNVVAARYSYERSDTHHALSFEATINSNQAFSIWYFAIVTLAVNKRDI